jgi:UDP-N-acetylglucosamine 2-epimerase (non-hydrolysing)
MRKTVLTLFGTRPEVIKLAPVVWQLESRPDLFRTVNVTSAQHTDLLYPFTRLLDVRIDHDLHVMEAHQTPTTICAKVLTGLDRVLDDEQPDAVLVQGDTSTALAGALAAFHRRIAVGHVEAGLRSGDAVSPFPEEMNRRLVTRLATWHFAATPQNRQTLLAEGVARERVFLTGNPVVDALRAILDQARPGAATRRALEATTGLRRVVLTTHRRESFGARLADNLRTLRRFVERHDDVALIFPVHPNPAVSRPAAALLGGHPRIHLLPALDYDEFLALLAEAWLIVSDSGGVQEEAPSLGKPLLILRDNTERPEVIEAGVARLVPGRPGRLALALRHAYRDDGWHARVATARNPFGRGDSGARIVDALARMLHGPVALAAPVSAGVRR